MSVELLTASGEFDDPPVEKQEIEKKFFIEDPHYFDEVAKRAGFTAIEQIYLSRPLEFGSLRLRRATTSKGSRFTATHKTVGRIIPNGVLRAETSASIERGAYAFYPGRGYATIHKHRAQLAPGVSLDLIDGYDEPILEIEDLGTNPEAQAFYQEHRAMLVDRTGEQDADNEWIAHELSGVDMSPERKGPDAQKIANELIAHKEVLGLDKMVVTIGGRSGSGKTTVARELQSLLGYSGKFPGGVALLSTDDYNRGLRWLVARNNGDPWENFDDPVVYDTKALALDVWSLQNGRSIEKRSFDFEKQEPVLGGTVQPADIVIVEGIHAGSRDLAELRKLHFEIDTPLVESVGWDLERIRRNRRANSSIGSAQARLAYQIEHAEPTYLGLEKPVNRRTWSESVRRPATTGQLAHQTPKPLDSVDHR